MLTLAVELRHAYRLVLVAPPGGAGAVLLARAADAGLATLPLEVRGEPAATARLRRWLREERVTIFHAHAGIGWEGHVATAAARAAGVPAVLRTEHLPYLITEPAQQAEHQRMLAQIDALICVSAAAHASFRAAGVPAGLLRVVRNGIKLHAARPNRAGVRAEFGLAAATPLLLAVGRLTEQKAHVDLIAAMALVQQQQPDAHLLIAGDGPLRKNLHAQISALGLESRVHLLGRRSDVPRLMAAADLFTLPSLFEGLPLVALEAMAAGLPVVATDVCGTAEAVIDWVTGRLVPPQNPGALATALLECLTMPERALDWGAAGRRRISDSFSAARMARETSAVYQEQVARLATIARPALAGAALSRTPLSARRAEA